MHFQNCFDSIVTFFGLLLGESQRFMDAVVARDEENMTAPESQQYAQCFLLFGYSDLNYLQVSQY